MIRVDTRGINRDTHKSFYDPILTIFTGNNID